MAIITMIKDRINQLNQASFQILCDALLAREGYPGIVALGTKDGAEKTTLGTPDTYFCLSGGKYVFAEYTTQKLGLAAKIRADIGKCMDEEYTGIPLSEIIEIVYCHTSSNISPADDRQLKSLCEEKGIKLTLLGIDSLAEMMMNYPSIIKHHLDLTVDSEQIQTIDDFIKQYLTEDMAAGLPQLAKTAAGAMEYPDLVPVNAKQVINNAKVSDHHAVIPTKEVSTAKIRELPKGEAEILKLVTVRLLCSVGLPCRFTETTVTITCAGETFSIRGKQILDLGWKAVMNHYYPAKEKEETVPAVQEGHVLTISNAEVKEGKTKPAQHYTEGSLLRAMETAGAEDISEEAERKGLGTPATRAGTIEKLIQKGFVIRSGDKKTKILLPTEKGTSLIAVMPEKLKSPMMTAEWEQKLLDMEHHSYDPGRFMGEIGAFVQDLIETQKAEQNIPGLASGGEKLGICPVCGAEIIERKQSYSCTNRDCRFALWKDNRFLQSIGKNLTRDLAVRLISGEKVKLKKCVSRKSGKTFDAVIWVTADVEGKASFSMELPQKGGRK